MFTQSDLHSLEVPIRLVTTSKDHAFFLDIQLTEMMLDVRRLDEKQAEYSMTAVRAVGFACDTCAMIFFYLPKGLIRLIRKEFITLKELC